jgi:hypothetical protein
MEHFFELPVPYNGTELMLKGRLVTFAYTYKFYIIAEGEELVFERDYDNQLRVLLNDAHKSSNIDPKLIAAIATVLDQVQSA